MLGVKLPVFVAFGFYNRWWRYVSTQDVWGARPRRRRRLGRRLPRLHAPRLPPGERPARDLDRRRPAAARARHRLAPARAHADRAPVGGHDRRARQGGRDRRRRRRGAADPPRDAAEPGARLHADRPRRRRPAQEEPAPARNPRPRARRASSATSSATAGRTSCSSRSLPPRARCASGSSRSRARSACPVKTLPGLPELIAGDYNLAGQIRPVEVEDLLGREPVEVGSRVDRRLPHRRGRARHGRRRIDRVGALPPDRARRPDAARARRQRRAGAVRDRARARRRARVPRDRRGPRPTPGTRRRCGRSSRSTARRSSSTPRRTSTSPLLEANPLEAVRNNTLATRTVADLAVEFGAKRFVLVSTDKAVNPKTLMGQSKALCEWIVEAWGHRDGHADALLRRALRERARLVRAASSRSSASRSRAAARSPSRTRR